MKTSFKLISILALSLAITACSGSKNSKPKNLAPTAKFDSACSNKICTFTSTSTDSDGTIASLLWTFPNGTTATTTIVEYEFAEYGEYTVTLKATDNLGDAKIASNTVGVYIDFHSAVATANLNDSSVIWSQDFNHRPDGEYTAVQLGEDLDMTIGEPYIDLNKLAIRNGEVAVTFNENQIGTGVGAFVPLNFDYNEMWLTFDVRFDENYDQNAKGGKLMGLGGHPNNEYPPTGCIDVGPDEGFSVRNQYRQQGRLTQYVYHQNKDANGSASGDGGICGEQLYIPDETESTNVFQFRKNQTYTIELRVIMNTPFESNGTAETYINGELAMKTDNWIFSESGIYGVNSWLFQLYIGGAEADWKLSTPSTLYLDNFALSTVRIVE